MMKHYPNYDTWRDLNWEQRLFQAGADTRDHRCLTLQLVIALDGGLFASAEYRNLQILQGIRAMDHSPKNHRLGIYLFNASARFVEI